jgi:hypothetical protein
MTGSSFTQGWLTLTGSFAIIALILTAFGIMLGIVKPADALGRAGAVMGVVVALIVLPGVLVSAWLDMSLWQQIGLVAVGIGIWKWLRPRRQPRDRRRE